MNKQINDLKGKALDQAVPYTWHHLNQVQMDDVLNKFAELIVRECITVIENKMPDFTCKEDYENLIRKAGRMDAIDEIEQHFGVEQ